MTFQDQIIETVENIYSALDSGELNTRQKAQRLRRAREKFEKEHPKRIKFIGKIFDKTAAGFIDRDGIPAGAEVSDEDEYIYERKPVETEIQKTDQGGMRLWTNQPTKCTD